MLGKIDEILAWEQRRETERDTKFVELGRYLCEVRAGQYWRLEKLKSFDDFLEKRFPGSRRKAYYLMSIHEHLPPQARKELKKWAGRRESSWRSWRAGIGSSSIVQPGCTKLAVAEGGVSAGGGKRTHREDIRAVGDCLLQTVQEPDAGHRAERLKRRL